MPSRSVCALSVPPLPSWPRPKAARRRPGRHECGRSLAPCIARGPLGLPHPQRRAGRGPAATCLTARWSFRCCGTTCRATRVPAGLPDHLARRHQALHQGFAKTGCALRPAWWTRSRASCWWPKAMPRRSAFAWRWPAGCRCMWRWTPATWPPTHAAPAAPAGLAADLRR